jgi:RimJ/RimL family protein N-acetyltransferase
MIETKRTILRPIEPTDNEQIFSYKSDSEANKYQGWIPKSLKDVDEFISKIPTEFNKPETWSQLVIIEKETDKIIGDIGVHFIDSNNFQCEIGCTLNKKIHGKGYATETVGVVIDYLFNKLGKHRIIASIDPENKSSIALVERLGFRKEAHFKQSLLINEKWVDDIIYAMLKSDLK